MHYVYRYQSTEKQKALRAESSGSYDFRRIASPALSRIESKKGGT